MAVGAAAIPWLIGAGTAASGVGAVMGAKASQPKMIPSPPPNPIFPGLNSQFTGAVAQGGQQGFNTLTSMARTGEPTDVGGVFSTLVAAQQRMMGQGRANLREQFGSMGLRYSSNFKDAAVDYETQTGKDFANILAQLAMQSAESAAGRKLGAASSLAEMFGNAGMAYTPSAVLSQGGQSAVGAGASSIGNSLTTLALLRSAGLFGGN